MFDQPRTRRHEIIGRGLIEGLSGMFLGFIISLGFGLLLELDDGELSMSCLHNFVPPVWLILSTLYFIYNASPKDEDRMRQFRLGLAAAYMILLLAVAASRRFTR